MLDLDGHPDPDKVHDRLDCVSGIANFALTQRITSVLESMKHAVSRAVAGKSFRTFRITARRAFKTFPQSSVELNRVLGAHVLDLRADARVDLTNPDLNVHVEVLPGETFVYCDRRP